MTALPDPRSFVGSKNSSPSSKDTVSKEPTQMSFTKVFDPHSFRAFFAERFSKFLHENYRNAEEVSVAFGVRYQTALNWWQGTNRPSGDVVAIASIRHGDDFTRHMEADNGFRP